MRTKRIKNTHKLQTLCVHGWADMRGRYQSEQEALADLKDIQEGCGPDGYRVVPVSQKQDCKLYAKRKPAIKDGCSEICSCTGEIT